MDYNKIIIALVIILVVILVAGFLMLNQTGNDATNNVTVNKTNDTIVVDTISQDNNSGGANEATSEPKQYYTKEGNLIVFDSDHSCHVVDSNGKTLPGSGSNYYMDGDRVVMTGQG